MFQNIANDFSDNNKNHYKDVKLNNEEIGMFLKRSFSRQNIILYVISFMISMVSFGGDISLGLAPFGLAILAATASSGIPISIVYIITLLGSFVGLGKDITANYFLTSLVFFATLFIVKTKKQVDYNGKIEIRKKYYNFNFCCKYCPNAFYNIKIIKCNFYSIAKYNYLYIL